MVEKKLLTAHELAKMLDLSVDTIWRYTREGRIPKIEVGPRQYRYVQTDVLQALHKNDDSGLVQEEQADYLVPPKLNYADYAKLPNEVGYTLQLIDGLIIRDPSPTFVHQRVSYRLQSILRNYLQGLDPGGEVFNAPLDIRLGEHTVLQPDLFYLPSSRPAKRDPVDSLPELVIEITSPSTATTDHIRKFRSYMKAGIPHYWIVDPDNCNIQCYALIDGSYSKVATFDEGTFTHPAFPGLSFQIAELFA